MLLGAGSANLSVGGWARNQEVYVFREISHNPQYQQVKRFFEPLLEMVGDESGLAELGVRRKFFGTDEAWRFHHAFETETFLEVLLEDKSVKQLEVWSPYFSEDLASLVEGIRNETGREDLKVAVVPDRSKNGKILTLWSDALEELVENDVLSFHEFPVSRSPSIELTHAKVWLAKGEVGTLAIGSWNFTKPGSASFEHRNVEAGIILSADANESILGKALRIDSQIFADKHLLEDEGLCVNEYPLPFELYVSFDWKSGSYNVTGRCPVQLSGKPYSLELPGLEHAIPLRWNARRKNGFYWLADPELNVVPDNEALLANHSYVVKRSGNIEYRGLILETGIEGRRANACSSLNELLDSLIVDDAPTITGPLRTVLRSGPDGVVDDDEGVAVDESLNYFRIFAAFTRFRQKLTQVKDLDELEKWLFFYPGCLQVLASMVRAKINEDGSLVLKWFLMNEVNALYEAAETSWKRFSPRKAYCSEKWKTLSVSKGLVKLPREITDNRRYMEQLKRECGYVG
jgi:hypothetical protein